MSPTVLGIGRRGKLASSVLATSALALTAVAGGVILSGGEAKAVPFCNPQGTAGPQTPPIVDNPASTPQILGYGFVTATCAGLPETTTGWHTETELTSQAFTPGVRLDTVDVDFNLDITNGGSMPGPTPTGPQHFFYNITSSDIIPSHTKKYINASLDANQLSGSGVTISKKIFYSAPADPLTSVADVILDWSGTAVSKAIAPPTFTIWVLDTYNIPTSLPSLDNVINSYETPGPLPILGAGAAFGFSRKLRGRIKATRTA